MSARHVITRILLLCAVFVAAACTSQPMPTPAPPATALLTSIPSPIPTDSQIPMPTGAPALQVVTPIGAPTAQVDQGVQKHLEQVLTGLADSRTGLAVAHLDQVLERLMAGRTTLIIAHQLSTIRNADKIVVLEGKRVVELGTHVELMARHGLYRHLNEVRTKVERQWAAVNARPALGVN